MNVSGHPSNTYVVKRIGQEALPVTESMHNGEHGIATYWKPTDEELAHLIRNGTIVVWLEGKHLPPSMVVGVAPA
jgi:hypothetical protein